MFGTIRPSQDDCPLLITKNMSLAVSVIETAVFGLPVGIQEQPKFRVTFFEPKLEPFLEPRASWTWNRRRSRLKKL